jgi:hypothetical protein
VSDPQVKPEDDGTEPVGRTPQGIFLRSHGGALQRHAEAMMIAGSPKARSGVLFSER